MISLTLTSLKARGSAQPAVVTGIVEEATEPVSCQGRRMALEESFELDEDKPRTGDGAEEGDSCWALC